MIKELTRKIIKFWNLSFLDKLEFFSSLISVLKGFFFYRLIFLEFGKYSWIKKPEKITNAKSISIGIFTHIESGAVLFAIKEFSGLKHNGEIKIGNYVYLNRLFNATSAHRIVIGDYVACGSNVSIFNYDHGWLDINKDCNSTPLIVHGEVNIGEGTWIGNNSVILGNISIGKHCIVGAGSIVTKDIPDYSVAVGNPARVIKQYDMSICEWRSI
jgi:acetyltransferase-like isoleucine patch superfamily enzyme